MRRIDLPPVEPPRAVALVLMSALGDTVRGLPLVASIRAAWPETELTWVVQPGPHQLLDGHPAVSEFLPFQRGRGMKAYADFRRRVRDREFDLVLDCQRAMKAGIVTRLLRAPVRLGYDRGRSFDHNWRFNNHHLPPGPPRHLQEELFEFLDRIGVPVVQRWEIPLTAEEIAARDRWFAELDGPVLTVVLRSSRLEKDWILSRYARVLDMARHDLGLRPVLAGGDSAEERADAERLKTMTDAVVRDALGGSVRQLVQLLSGSALVLSPDTGPLHIAAALGTPTIGLFGATDPRYYGPYGPFEDLVIDRYGDPERAVPDRRIRSGRMKMITEDDVCAVLERAARIYVTGAAPRGQHPTLEER